MEALPSGLFSLYKRRREQTLRVEWECFSAFCSTLAVTPEKLRLLAASHSRGTKSPSRRTREAVAQEKKKARKNITTILTDVNLLLSCLSASLKLVLHHCGFVPRE